MSESFIVVLFLSNRYPPKLLGTKVIAKTRTQYGGILDANNLLNNPILKWTCMFWFSYHLPGIRLIEFPYRFLKNVWHSHLYFLKNRKVLWWNFFILTNRLTKTRKVVDITIKLRNKHPSPKYVYPKSFWWPDFFYFLLN